PGRVIGTSLANPDFSALARIYGFHGERITKTEEFPEAFRRAQASKSGALLELVIDPEAITARQSLSQIRQAAMKR
ncbi:MAG: thiamine pyrophosphate-dependent enzyme, partial [Kiloniellales bacterium]|nr:thiamine pyrophosphate-dependent enzyme [Kiloniellales bacterium]